MSRLTCLLGLLVIGTAHAAPVPKVASDPLPDGALVRLGKLRFRGPHTGGVTFSADSNMLFATDGKATLYRWDAGTGRPLDPIDTGVKGVWASWVTTDRMVMVRAVPVEKGKGCTLAASVYHIRTGKLTEFDTEFVTDRLPDPDSAPTLLLSGDGRWLHGHFSNRKRVYDTDEGVFAVQLPAEAPESATAAITRDGKLFFSRGNDKVLQLALDEKDGPVELGAAFKVIDFALTPDEKSVVGVGTRKEKAADTPVVIPVAVWPVGQTVPQEDFEVSAEVVYLSAVGKTFLLAGRPDETHGQALVVDRWDFDTHRRAWSVTVPFRVRERDERLSGLESVFRVVASPDGKRVAVSNGENILAVYDAATGKRTDAEPAHDDHVLWVGFSADGKTATTAGHDGVRTWNPVNGEQLSAARPAGDTPHWFSGLLGGVPMWTRTGSGAEQNIHAVGLDITTGRPAWTFSPKLRGGACPFWLFGDRMVAAEYGRKDGDKFVVFDDARKEVARWAPPADVSESLESGGVRVGDDLVLGSRAVGKNGERSVTRLSLADGKVVKSFAAPKGKTGWYVTPRAASADGRLVALYGPDGWAITDADGKLLATTPATGKEPGPFAFRPDGKAVLVGDERSPTVRLVTLADATKPRTFTGRTPASAVAFSPDGKKAVVGYRDGTALIWDASK